MEKRKLTKKEKTFCYLYTNTGDMCKAAVKAGFETNPEQAAFLLLQKDEVKEEINKNRNEYKRQLSHLALKGYERLAFGNISDAVRLLYAPQLDDLQLEKMDLFCVSEIKKKDDLVEIKFFNRLNAMEKLLQAEEEEVQTSVPFYQALKQGVEALNK